MVRRNWRHIVVWILIFLAANALMPGADLFTSLIPAALGIAAYEIGRRWIVRERSRSSRTPLRARSG